MDEEGEADDRDNIHPEEVRDEGDNNAQDQDLSDDDVITAMDDVADQINCSKASRPMLIIGRAVRKHGGRQIYNGTCSWCGKFFANHLSFKRHKGLCKSFAFLPRTQLRSRAARLTV
jgi:hypothetical protein